MEKDKLRLVQPNGSASLSALQQGKGSLWRDVFTPVVLMYTLAYFFLCNTLSALSVWTPLILKSFNPGQQQYRHWPAQRRTAYLYHYGDDLVEQTF